MALTHRLFPFLAWIGEARQPATLRADLVAGITVALVLVPQSMAYAQLAGLPPIHGLYASFLPVMVAALFGSSRQLATGPVAVVSLLTAAALAPISAANPESAVLHAAMLALLVGVLQIGMGLLRLGVLVDFLSHPVVAGFTNAAALIIATSQLDKLLGVSAPRGEQHYETVWNVISVLPAQLHLPTLAMAVTALGIMLAVKRLAPRLPAVLVAVVVTVLLSWGLEYQAAGGRVVGAIPVGLPGLVWPDFEWELAFGLVEAAITITLIGFMEAISIAKAIAAQKRQRLDANQELVGQGLGNLAAGLFQGYPVSGSFSRSAVNFSAGAVTGLASVITAAVVAVVLLWLTPLLYHLPQATLAAVIMMAVLTLLRPREFLTAWRVQRSDGVIGVVVFLLTLYTAPHLDVGLLVGILLSLVLYVLRAMRPHMASLSRHPDGTLRDAAAHGLPTCDAIAVMRFDGRLFFANAGYFESRVIDYLASHPKLKFIILDAESINHVDASAEHMLDDIANLTQAAEVEFLIARAKRDVMDTLIRAGLVGHMGENHFFRTRTKALEYAWSRLDADHANTCPLAIRPE